MIFGKVAPAPLSCTCAAAGTAAPSSAVRARSRVFFTRSSSGLGQLKHELRLEQELIRGGPAALGLHAIEVSEQPDVGAQLVRCAADDPRVAIVGDVVVGIEDVDAR